MDIDVDGLMILCVGCDKCLVGYVSIHIDTKSILVYNIS